MRNELVKRPKNERFVSLVNLDYHPSKQFIEARNRANSVFINRSVKSRSADNVKVVQVAHH